MLDVIRINNYCLPEFSCMGGLVTSPLLMDYEGSPSAMVCGSNLRPGDLSERIQNGLPVLIVSISLIVKVLL